MNHAYVTAKGVSVYYKDFLALKNINFECKEGEFVSIVGESGVGKTTFLNALAGFIPFKGKIKVPKKIGYVFQSFALFPWMTVEKNIGFGLEDLDRPERMQRIAEMLKQTGMENFKNRRPHQLSGGQVQRIAFARSLAPNPDLLLMDEPYGAIDHHTRDKMQDWLLSLWEKSRKTIIFVTHYIEEAIYLADRIIIVKNKGFVESISIPFSRPRKSDIRFSERFLDMKYQILDYMKNED